ncbi:MAG: helix-turn-helix domain-containing protein [Alphaproteobacteria bacterium]|nr:helix-turn-helix domain-containing protein [Alphaproteobacteria bacterium]MDA8003588.1 helix-turn-helix domain-containing protein [Alphaproteobacteria bacterium]MDA8005456.1 helix-turn-helix domain-containing protein [Alphaproteobacteria bacterium]MDA8012936.1 helix-turn-helix domain-containing protein [Alphaproteobacteria bacterium]
MLSPAPKDTGFSTVQAAEILGMSHSYLLKILDNDAIPSYEEGGERRIRTADLMDYKKRRKIRKELTRMSQKWGLGYQGE